MQSRSDNRYFTEFRELFRGYRAAPQNFDSPVSERDNGRFEAMWGRPGIDDEWDKSIELLSYMGGVRGADSAKPIRARRGQRTAECADDFGENGVCAEANG